MKSRTISTLLLVLLGAWPASSLSRPVKERPEETKSNAPARAVRESPRKATASEKSRRLDGWLAGLALGGAEDRVAARSPRNGSGNQDGESCKEATSDDPETRIQELQHQIRCLARLRQDILTEVSGALRARTEVDSVARLAVVQAKETAKKDELAALQQARKDWWRLLRNFGVGFVVGINWHDAQSGDRVGKAEMNTRGEVEITDRLNTTMDIAFESHWYVVDWGRARFGPVLMVNPDVVDDVRLRSLGVGVAVGWRLRAEEARTLNLGVAYGWDRFVGRLPTDFVAGGTWPKDPETMKPAALSLNNEVSGSWMLIVSFTP